MKTTETLKFYCKMLPSMIKEKAIDILEKDEVNYRVVKEDDKDFVISSDLKSDRLNLEIKEGIVTKCDIW